MYLHNFFVPHTLSILLPQTAGFRFSIRALIRQLGLVEQRSQLPTRTVFEGREERAPALAHCERHAFWGVLIL